MVTKYASGAERTLTAICPSVPMKTCRIASCVNDKAMVMTVAIVYKEPDSMTTQKIR